MSSRPTSSRPLLTGTSLQQPNVGTLQFFSRNLTNHHLLETVPLFSSYLLIKSTSLSRSSPLRFGERRSGPHICVFLFLCVWMEERRRGPAQAGVVPSAALSDRVSPPGKQRFRELLCFPFTEKITIKMNQGLFFPFWKLRIRGRRKNDYDFLKCGRRDIVSGERR